MKHATVDDYSEEARNTRQEEPNCSHPSIAQMCLPMPTLTGDVRINYNTGAVADRTRAPCSSTGGKQKEQNTHARLPTMIAHLHSSTCFPRRGFDHCSQHARLADGADRMHTLKYKIIKVDTSDP